MGFSRQEYWSELPFPPPRDLPHPGIQLASLTSLALADSVFITSTTWEAHKFLRFSSVQLLSHIRLPATPWTVECQASLSITSSRCLLKLMSTESVMPFNHLILRHPLLLLPSIIPSIRVFSNESALRIRWPKYWSFSFNMSPSNEHSGLISLGWTGWISLQPKVLKSLPQHNSSKSSILRHSAFSLTPVNDHWKNHSLD